MILSLSAAGISVLCLPLLLLPLLCLRAKIVVVLAAGMDFAKDKFPIRLSDEECVVGIVVVMNEEKFLVAFIRIAAIVAIGVVAMFLLVNIIRPECGDTAIVVCLR